MIIPADYAQVNLHFGGPALPFGAEVTFGLVLEAAATIDDVVNDMAATFSTGVSYTLAMNPQTTLVEVSVKFGPNATGPSATAAIGVVGTTGTSGVSPAVCVLIHKRTALGGRHGRGRMYLPGLWESAVSAAGQLESGIASFFTDLWEDIRTQIEIHGHNMVLLHTDATAPTPITSLACDAAVASQRTRQRR